MLSRPVPRFRLLIAAVAGLAVLASADTAHADTIDFTGNTNNLAADPNAGYDPVSFSGIVTVTVPVGSTTSATVSVMLKNTTSVGDAATPGIGYITGFGFNLPGSLTTSSAKIGNFNFLTAAGAATNLQAGEFDYAFSTSATQLHTVASPGEVMKGLTANQSATFTFVVSGNGASSLTAAQIINDTSGSGVPFSVRFRSTDTSLYKGHKDPDGDKVAASVVPPKPGIVPAPPGVLLAGMGLGCMLIGRIRFRRTTPPQA